MSICDQCFAPGHCCKNIQLYARGSDDKVFLGQGFSHLEMLVWLATVETGTEEDPTHGLPFMPLYKRQDGIWSLWCPNLTLDGRCGDYENRPQLCKRFEPAVDFPCVFAGVPT